MTDKDKTDETNKDLPTNQAKPLVPWIIMLVGLGLLAWFYFATKQG